MKESVKSNPNIEERLLQYGLIIDEFNTTADRVVIVDQYTGEPVIDLSIEKNGGIPCIVSEIL